MLQSLKRYCERKDGSISMETAILFPVFIPMLLMTFELLLFIANSSQLDHAIQETMTEVRNGKAITVATDANLDPDQYYKISICDRMYIPRCLENIEVKIKAYDKEVKNPVILSVDFPAREETVSMDVDVNYKLMQFMGMLFDLKDMKLSSSIFFNTEP